MMTIASMAPAIGGAVFGTAIYLYALYLRRGLDRSRARRVHPAE